MIEIIGKNIDKQVEPHFLIQLSLHNSYQSFYNECSIDLENSYVAEDMYKTFRKILDNKSVGYLYLGSLEHLQRHIYYILDRCSKDSGDGKYQYDELKKYGCTHDEICNIAEWYSENEDLFINQTPEGEEESDMYLESVELFYIDENGNSFDCIVE